MRDARQTHVQGRLSFQSLAPRGSRVTAARRRHDLALIAQGSYGDRARGWRVTGRAPDPRIAPLPPGITSPSETRVARDIRPLMRGAPASTADAPARPPGSPRHRADAAPERASDHASGGTLPRTRAVSSSPTARVRTSSGTRCIDGTCPASVLGCGAWISIPPRAHPGRTAPWISIPPRGGSVSRRR